MDPAVNCLSCLCSCYQSPVIRDDMSKVVHVKEKLDDLEKALQGLLPIKEDIQREIEDHRNNREQPNSTVQHWVDQVGKTNDKVNKLLDEYSKGNHVAGPSLNCFSRYMISRNAIKLKQEITQLTDRQPKMEFVPEPQPEPVPESNEIVGKEIISKLDIARSYLADEIVQRIGIWGMGGVGKTTLLTKIKQLVLNDANMGFDHVLFIEASQNIQLEKLREAIAKELNLAPSASKKDIENALKSKNFVLLLDNIWKEIDFKNLGIPHLKDSNTVTAHYKRKVIFTTRSENVCTRMCERGKIIKVECLEPDEAWDLFKDNVNLDVIESDETFKEIARQVMKNCGGLPLALQVIGKAMSNKETILDWESILNSLKNSGIRVVEGVQESLLPILKFSYDNLSGNIQECFLSASILRGSSKDDLFGCWMGLGLIGDFENLQGAYASAECMRKILEESCLLHFSDEGNVDLHDVIYEMAMWIASDCGRNMNKWMVKSYYATDTENWRLANRVIICGDVKHLPVFSRPFSNLKCFMIQGSSSLKEIPEGYFQQMPNLTYLDLSRTTIEKLPNDINCLVNLQYLNISFTKISSLPTELVCLKRLQYLLCRNLNWGENGLMIMPSCLDKLKVIDLYPHMRVEPEELEKLKEHIKAIGMRVVSEGVLQKLSSLPTTQLYIENLDNLSSLSFDTLSCKDHGYLQELEITSCPDLKELVMNGRETRLNNLTIRDVEQLQNIIWEDVLPHEYFRMLKRLCIYKCKLTSFAWVVHLPCLTHLEIRSATEIKMLFDVKEEAREIQQQVSKLPIFPALQFMSLINLPRLVSISNFELDFPRLSWFYAEECPNLEKLPFKRGTNNNERMKHIDCEKKWWESPESDGAIIPSHSLDPFHGLIVSEMVDPEMVDPEIIDTVSYKYIQGSLALLFLAAALLKWCLLLW